MAEFKLVQLNLAKMRHAIDAPEMAPFVADLDLINTIAEEAAGFVWRLVGDTDTALTNRLFGEQMLVNMSVWESVAALREFVFESRHLEIMQKHRALFERTEGANAVLWWKPAGQIPTLVEGGRKLALLQEHGASADAFTFKSSFEAPAAT